jgi:hypothetical protein
VTSPSSASEVAVACHYLDVNLLPNDALALGAALIRTALQAKEGRDE